VGEDQPITDFDVVDETDVFGSEAARKKASDEDTSPGARK
jgi:hypothetical protein